jgi:hypothetical protein
MDGAGSQAPPSGLGNITASNARSSLILSITAYELAMLHHFHASKH